jgi:hypothetical protein
MKVGSETEELGNPHFSALCPPQIPYDLIWSRTGSAAVGSRRLTA